MQVRDSAKGQLLHVIVDFHNDTSTRNSCRTSCPRQRYYHLRHITSGKQHRLLENGDEVVDSVDEILLRLKLPSGKSKITK